MRAVVWYTAVSVWLVALAVCLVAALLGSALITVAFPIMMAAATVAAVLCYGIKRLVLTAVPVIGGAMFIAWVLSTVGVAAWIVMVVVSVGIGVLLSRFDRAFGRTRTVGLK